MASNVGYQNIHEPSKGQKAKRPKKEEISTSMLDDDELLHGVDIKAPDADLERSIEDDYDRYQSSTSRSFQKVVFSFCTLGLGALYLWARTKIVPQGCLAVRVTRAGEFVILPPGRHSNLPGEEFYGTNQPISQDFVNLGANKIVTIRDGQRGESYKNGRLVVLPPGRHLLDSLHNFVKSISMDQDEVDLGPKKIITVKNGFVGIAYVKGVLKILKEGRHELNLPDERFGRFLSMQQEVIELPRLDVKTTDNINVTVHAVLNYRIVDPVKAVTCVDNLEKSLEQLAEVTLSAILRRFSFRDLSPVPVNESGEELGSVDMDGNPVEAPKLAKGKSKAKHFASDIQAKMHDDLHKDFEDVVHEWGVEIIGNVQLKTIHPSDETLRRAIAEMAINTAKADAQRRQAEFERQVVNTKAIAEKESAILRAEGETESKLIAARGLQQATVINAKADAEALRLISKAKLECTENEGKAAEALNSPIAMQLAVLSKQIELVTRSKIPVFIPATDVGSVNIWAKDRETNTMTHFTNQKQDGSSSGGQDQTQALLANMLATQMLDAKK